MDITFSSIFWEIKETWKASKGKKISIPDLLTIIYDAVIETARKDSTNDVSWYVEISERHASEVAHGKIDVKKEIQELINPKSIEDGFRKYIEENLINELNEDDFKTLVSTILESIESSSNIAKEQKQYFKTVAENSPTSFFVKVLLFFMKQNNKKLSVQQPRGNAKDDKAFTPTSDENYTSYPIFTQDETGCDGIIPSKKHTKDFDFSEFASILFSYLAGSDNQGQFAQKLFMNIVPDDSLETWEYLNNLTPDTYRRYFRGKPITDLAKRIVPVLDLAKFELYIDDFDQTPLNCLARRLSPFFEEEVTQCNVAEKSASLFKEILIKAAEKSRKVKDTGDSHRQEQINYQQTLFFPSHNLPTPINSERFIRRETKEKEILRLLKNGCKQIFIRGEGGVGKSEFIIQLANHLNNNTAFRCYFTTYKGNLHETIADLHFPGFNSTPTASMDSHFQEKLELLRQLDANHILIIDNFNGSEETLIGDQCLQSLERLDMRCVFTTRTHLNKTEVLIDPLDEPQLLDLMRYYLRERFAEDDLKKIIQMADRHTLTIDLIAQLLKKNMSGLTPSVVCEKLSAESMNDAIWKPISIDYNREHVPKKLLSHLQTVFDLSKFSNSQMHIINCATLIGNERVSSRLFLDLFGTEYEDELAGLCSTGWIRFDSAAQSISMHPLIQMICRYNERFIPWFKECCDEKIMYKIVEIEPNYLHERERHQQLGTIFCNTLKHLTPSQLNLWHHHPVLANFLVTRISDLIDNPHRTYSFFKDDIKETVESLTPLGNWKNIGDALAMQAAFVRIFSSPINDVYYTLCQKCMEAYFKANLSSVALIYAQERFRVGLQIYSIESKDHWQCHVDLGQVYYNCNMLPEALKMALLAYHGQRKHHLSLRISCINLYDLFCRTQNMHCAALYGLRAIATSLHIWPKLSIKLISELSVVFASIIGKEKAQEFSNLAKRLEYNHSNGQIADVESLYIESRNLRLYAINSLNNNSIVTEDSPIDHRLTLSDAYFSLGDEWYGVAVNTENIEAYRIALECYCLSLHTLEQSPEAQADELISRQNAISRMQDKMK